MKVLGLVVLVVLCMLIPEVGRIVGAILLTIGVIWLLSAHQESAHEKRGRDI